MNFEDLAGSFFIETRHAVSQINVKSPILRFWLFHRKLFYFFKSLGANAIRPYTEFRNKLKGMSWCFYQQPEIRLEVSLQKIFENMDIYSPYVRTGTC